jgi:GT2 family glycosyltransferase
MKISVVIPVWNGAPVISDCLTALYTHSGEELLEVVCVDNASHDESVTLIAECFPRTRLIRQPVNLGFAGGVNAGMEAAQGDVFILLNQDCVVQPGWLTEFVRAFQDHPEFGIAGCTILNPDGTVNHAGAMLHRPDMYGVHLTDVGDGQPRSVEYVTGAAFAVRRSTWDAVGHFDEGFYPAYYEESDYCCRARRKGIETGYVPGARVAHLFSGREWQSDPIRHTANQHTSRYRFVCKHLAGHDLAEFFEAERAAIDAEHYWDQLVARVIAARDTLRGLPDILERRRLDLGDVPSLALRRQVQVGFTQVLRQSFAAAEKLGQVGLVEPEEPVDGGQQQAMHALTEELKAAAERLETLRRREYDLLTRIYFKSPSGDRPESSVRRLVRLVILRPLSFLIGRDYLLLSELNTVHVARIDQMNDVHALRERVNQQTHQHVQDQMNRLYYRLESLNRRMKLLETLADYDYR